MTEKQNNMVVQHPDKRLMERIRSLERNERIRLHIAQMKCNGYTDNECKTWLIKIAILSDFMDVLELLTKLKRFMMTPFIRLLMRVEVLRLRNEKNWISNGIKPIAKSWLIERKCGLRSLTIRSNII